MRFQTCVFSKDGSMQSEIVRARNTSEALRKMVATKDVAHSPCGYAYPLGHAQLDKRHWRWAIRCSVTGEVTMSRQKPSDFDTSVKASLIQILNALFKSLRDSDTNV